MRSAAIFFWILAPDDGIELFDQLMIDLAAGGQEAMLDIVISGQGIEASGQLTDKPFAQFQPDIVPLAIGHGAGGAGIAGGAGEVARLVCDSIDQFVVGIRVVELFKQFETGRAAQVVLLDFERFKTGQVRDDHQCFLHSHLSGLNWQGRA